MNHLAPYKNIRKNMRRVHMLSICSQLSLKVFFFSIFFLSLFWSICNSEKLNEKCPQRAINLPKKKTTEKTQFLEKNFYGRNLKCLCDRCVQND